jgi:HEAT repeat protein
MRSLEKAWCTVNSLAKTIFVALVIGFGLCLAQDAVAQNKGFTPVEGANLKARIDNAVAAGRANAPGGRFWVAYQFEARPGVAVDFEVVDSSGGVYISMDGTSVSFDSRYETRELGLFQLFETQRDLFTRAEVYNLKRTREYSGYPVYWAGRVGNEESLNYLKAIMDSTAPETNRLADRAAFAIALHDDAQVESILTNLIRRPIAEPLRSRAIYWLGYTPESQTKNAFLIEIIRNDREWSEPRQQAMSALGMSRMAATLPVLENLYETMTSRDLRQRALGGIARNDNRDGAASYLIRIADNEKDLELRKGAISGLGRIPGEKSLGALTNLVESDPDPEMQKQAVRAIARRSRDEAIPVLIRIARSHPKMPVRKQAIQALGQTGDERAVALFTELLNK